MMRTTTLRVAMTTLRVAMTTLRVAMTTLLGSLAVLGACLIPGSASASQTAELRAGFTPDRLGASTTIRISLSIQAPPGELPPPLTSADIRLPKGLIFNSSELGLATCSAVTLAEHGPSACSPESLIGHGSALVGIRLGPQALYERARLTLLMAPLTEDHTTVLFYAAGDTPVIARMMFPSLLLDDSGPFSGRLDTTIPLVRALPGGPGLALLRLSASIGPAGLTYHRRLHGALVPYVPHGFSVPLACPRKGFPFAAELKFEDGTSAYERTFVPCPAADRGSRHARPRRVTGLRP